MRTKLTEFWYPTSVIGSWLGAVRRKGTSNCRWCFQLKKRSFSSDNFSQGPALGIATTFHVSERLLSSRPSSDLTRKMV